MKKLFTIFFVFIALNGSAQTLGITDFMRLNPYSLSSNPAHFIPYNGYVGIPAISNINLNLYNPSLRYNNLIKTEGKTTIITANKFVDKLSKKNLLNSEIDFELLGFGFRVKKLFISVGYRVKFDEHFNFSKDLMGFLLRGNLATDADGNYLYTKDSPANLEMGVNVNAYQEIGVGAQYQLLDNLTIGIKPKILFGIMNINTVNCQANVYTNPEDYAINGIYNVKFKMASAIPFYRKDEHGKVIIDINSITNNIGSSIGGLFSKNVGFGFDLGAVYRINKELRVGLAFTDIGFIRWKGSPLELSVKPPTNGSFEFTGFNADQITNFINNGININIDTFLNKLDIVEIKPYTTAITTKMTAHCSFDLTPCNRFTAQFKGYIAKKSFIPQLTLAYNGTFWDAIDVVVSYSMTKKSFDNLGIGLGFRAGPVHLYLGTDNVLAAINILNARRANATFGLVVDFPFKVKIKETELKSILKKKETEEVQPDVDHTYQ